ncbi:hypothetical protein [Serratia sp. DD3]|uniref:hypothetical protein n=1 Tax=Serratia sp. DD3 TaxID=1410619 RepID=UPI0003C4EE40|nr:hypothetical protein [Serratia sp. DD3]KEY59104.1 hypothetical protein SRDD_20520 [Serratia sp. DD3]
MKSLKPRRPQGRWIYYILYEDILWPCPVKWEWENNFGMWLPFYYSPTLEFVAGDPAKAVKVTKSLLTSTQSKRS